MSPLVAVANFHELVTNQSGMAEWVRREDGNLLICFKVKYVLTLFVRDIVQNAASNLQ